jgi:hypothetical protein
LRVVEMGGLDLSYIVAIMKRFNSDFVRIHKVYNFSAFYG